MAISGQAPAPGDEIDPRADLGGARRDGRGGGSRLRRSDAAARADDPNFSRPIQRIMVMIVFLGVVGALTGVLYQQTNLAKVFTDNLALNGFIAFVFVVGIFLAFYQVFRLFSAINWIEALAVRARGIESVPPPSLLVSMDPLRKNLAARGVASTTARTILDSVGTRIEESRELLRYTGGLLIFLGLLGTFWGLAITVPAIVEVISQVSATDESGGVSAFQSLLASLQEQLDGMGVAFASSLFGLAGSLVVGFLDLMSASALNRFYSDLETWLSSRTRFASEDGAPGVAGGGDMAEQVGVLAQQMAGLNRTLSEGEERRARETERLAAALRQMTEASGEAGGDRTALLRAVEGQDRVAAAIERLIDSGGVGGAEGIDAETRRHIRNIDVLLAKMIEETAAGRVETADALRRELRAVGRAMSELGNAVTGASR